MLSKSNKKGSHVGLVVSFLIFIIFISFLRVIVEPALTTDDEKKVILEDVYSELVQSASVEVKTTTIRLNSAVGESCISLGDFISDFDLDPGIIVKDIKGVFLSASISPGNSNTLQVSKKTGDSYFKIYSSNGFTDLGPESSTCSAISEGSDYEVGGTVVRDYLLEERVLDLIDSYSASPRFQKSKDSPSYVNIGLAFLYDNGTIVSTRDRDTPVNVFIKEEPIEYIDPFGNIRPGKLRVKLW